MIYLLLSIICSTCLLVVFKVIERKRIEKLPVIVINYFIAAAIGALTTTSSVSFTHFTAQPWFPLAFLLGAFFVVVFYSVALSTQLNGISVTSVAFKLSLVIPVLAAWLLYGDEFGATKIAGILLALAAIILTSKNSSATNTTANVKGFAVVLPAFVFIGSGICDSVFNYIQHEYLAPEAFSSFLIILFLTAGATGSLMLAYGVLKGKYFSLLKALIGGICLGVPNYGSAYFMILALEYSGVEASALWPLNNIGIILLSTAVAAALFGERPGARGLGGILIAIISILLISWSAC